MQNQAVSIEDALLHSLRFKGFDEANLKELVAIAAGLHKAGLGNVRVFPKGIPVVDGVRVSGILETSEVAKFLSNILAKTPRLGRIQGFPYGIPWPEVFELTIDIGNTPEIGIDART